MSERAHFRQTVNDLTPRTGSIAVRLPVHRRLDGLRGASTGSKQQPRVRLVTLRLPLLLTTRRQRAQAHSKVAYLVQADTDAAVSGLPQQCWFDAFVQRGNTLFSSDDSRRIKRRRVLRLMARPVTREGRGRDIGRTKIKTYENGLFPVVDAYTYKPQSATVRHGRSTHVHAFDHRARLGVEGEPGDRRGDKHSRHF